MRSRLRRTDANGFELSVKMTIGASSKSITESEAERLRHSVIPIIGADLRRRPYLVGSAVLLVYKDRKILVTAEHVLSDNVKVPLSFFGSSGYSRPFGGNFAVSEANDLAAKLLTPDEIDALSHVPFIGEVDIGRAATQGEHFYASVAGYAATAARRKDKLTLDTPMTVYSNFATEQPDGSVSIAFNKKEGVEDASGHINPRDPYGMSGGAIFGLSVNGIVIKPRQTAKLIGIATRWKRAQKQMRGASIAEIVPLLDQLVE